MNNQLSRGPITTDHAAGPLDENATTQPAKTDAPNSTPGLRPVAFKAQAVCEGQAPWPYIGNVFQNADGSLSLLLDVGTALTLKSGRTMPSTDSQRVKVHIRAARR